MRGREIVCVCVSLCWVSVCWWVSVGVCVCMSLWLCVCVPVNLYNLPLNLIYRFCCAVFGHTYYDSPKIIILHYPLVIQDTSKLCDALSLTHSYTRAVEEAWFGRAQVCQVSRSFECHPLKKEDVKCIKHMQTSMWNLFWWHCKEVDRQVDMMDKMMCVWLFWSFVSDVSLLWSWVALIWP